MMLYDEDTKLMAADTL